jgi:PAS domain S-box-containing protein
MKPLPVPPPADEEARLEALRRHRILDTPPEEDFDALVRLAALVCGTPVALVSLVDAERQWLKAGVGVWPRETPREHSLCAHAILKPELLCVEDARQDPRFALNPLVTGAPGIRFYAGAPLLTPEGHALGTLCVIDHVPRKLAAEQLEALEALARHLVHLLGLRRQLAELHESVAERDRAEHLERKVAEQALRESEERYRDLFEGASDLIQAVAPDGRLLYTNRAWRETLGYSEAEAGALTLLDVVHPDNRAECLELFQWVAEGGQVDTAQLVFVSKLGQRIVVEGSVNCRRDADGRPVSTRAILRDVTERRRAEEALRASEARTRSILDNMLGGLITIDRRGRIDSVNRAAEEIFGYSRDELIGQHAGILIGAEPGEEAQARLREGFARALGRVTEWQGRRKSGEEFPFELSLFEFDTPEGTQYAGSVQDVSERRQVDRLKKEFVSTVSHELRTPLTSIRGSLSLLSAGVLGELPDEAKDVLEIAERNAVRLIGLINDILDLERLETGRLEMHLQPTPAVPVLQRSMEAVRGMAEQQGIALEVTAEELSVLGDADRLVQVVVNLASNAVKFSPSGGTVRVSVRPGAGFAEFAVEDQGRGVPKRLQAAIFERFKQVQASDAREKGGTGLGLAICKAIVEQHGGEIGVLSEEGKGSRFYFRIPLSHAEPELAAAQPPAPAAGGESASEPERLDPFVSVLRGGPGGAPHRDVVVADDDEALLGVLARQLLSQGIPVRTARDGRQAMRLATDLPPALLVLDVSLPGADAFAVVEALRREPRLASTPLLVYSGMDLTTADRARLQLGPTRFLTKSRASDREFLEVVLEMLGRGPRLAEVR